MAALEEAVRSAAAKGLTHLSLHPVPSEDNKTVYWRCTATPSTMHKYVHVTTTDPVEAILTVLAALPKASQRKAPEPRLLNGEQQKLTATVTPPAEWAPLPPGDGPVFVSDPAPHSVPDADDEWSRFK